MSYNDVPVKVGLIGTGNMGRNHLRVLALLKQVEVAFIYDENRQVARDLAAANGVVTADSLEELLPLADAVLICTPTVTHSAIMRQVSRYVRNIFVEKPLSHTLRQSIDDARFIKENGLNVQVGFIERYNPAVIQLKAVIESGAQIISIDFTRTNKLSARITDVDVVADLMIHDIDLALYLNGPVEEVNAHGYVLGDMIALASANLRHTNGRLSRVHASRVTERKIRQIQATCQNEFIDCELLRKELLVSRQSKIIQEEGKPYTVSAYEHLIEVPQQEALLSELQVFVQSCRDYDVEKPDEDDGLAAAMVCERIQEAILK